MPDHQPKRLVVKYFNRPLFLLWWPTDNSRLEIDRHLAPLSCYEPYHGFRTPENQLLAPTPSLLDSLSDTDKTRYLAAWAAAQGRPVYAQPGLVTEVPAGGL